MPQRKSENLRVHLQDARAKWDAAKADLLQCALQKNGRMAHFATLERVAMLEYHKSLQEFGVAVIEETLGGIRIDHNGKE